MDRKTLQYAYVGSLGVVALLVNLRLWTYDEAHADDLLRVVFLCVAAPLLNIPQVRIEQGRISLVGIVNQASALLLNPLDASLVGLASSISTLRRGAFPLLANAVFSACINLVGSSVALEFRSDHVLPLYARFVAVAVCSLTNLVLVVIAFRLTLGEPLKSISTRTWNAPFYVAFGYSSLAAILISYVMDGSLLGYALATIVFGLALALTDTIAGRRVRRVLESELSDADRHLFHSRAVEGVVHNLRNHMATAVGYLKEIDARRLDPVDRDAVETAAAAANDAVTVLHSLAQGATPRVSYATEPIDLNELASRALGMARPRARSKEIELGLRESQDAVTVRADPLLLREVITNLVNNAIDAAPQKGRVDLATGRRGNGWPYFSVSDNGPGVSDENRHHLFEPHFTTKETGTGLGLFMSYGIVREHQGQLLYEGSRRGAVFTVVLPPFANYLHSGDRGDG
jgi:signal transduction histidine kinase